MSPTTSQLENPQLTVPVNNRWQALASDVLNGQSVTIEDARAILASANVELLDLLHAAYRIRHQYFGNTVQLYFLMNAKSGLCPEDCNYCSQSKIAKSDVPKYNFLDRETILKAAQAAADRQAKTFCLVISGRAPSEREMQAVERVVPEVKARHNLNVCACLGLLDAPQAIRLKQCGVDRVNHNLNTGSEYYQEICSTHSFQDRLDTLKNVRSADLEICSGGIIGMGESDDQAIQMAFELRELRADSIPLNFLNPIEGTPLENRRELSPQDCLRGLAMFRFVNPNSEIRIAGGREINLRSLQPLGLFPANSIFVGDYLTTEGQPPESDYQMIKDLGFEIVLNPEHR